MTRLPRLLVAVLLLLLLAGCASRRADLHGQQLAPAVDLQRYAGRWYVIANVPYFPERGKVGTYVEYVLRDDGRIDDLYYFRKPSLADPVRRWEGIGRVLEGSGNAHWKVSFVWPFTVDYLILAVDPDYQWALVGWPDRSLAWVFGRHPQMAEPLYQSLLDRLQAQGYDRSRLVRIPQLEAQPD